MKITLIKKTNKIKEIDELLEKSYSKGDFMFHQKSKTNSTENIIRDKNLNLFIISDKEKMIGFCLLLIRENTKEIKHVAKLQAISVLKEYRSKGVGQELLSYVLTWVKNKKKQLIYLEVISENKNAIALYKKLGFVKTGEIKDYACFNDKKYGLSTYTLY